MTTKQKTLEPVADEPRETSLAVREPEPEPRGGALADLRAGMMFLDPDRMTTALGEYDERRTVFRNWLLSKMQAGVHFGFAPGTKPKFDDRGNMLVWNKKKNGYDAIPQDQWTAKPSLYKPGAELVCDLLGVRPRFEADVAAWQQMGSRPGTFVFACYLHSKATGELLGEGRGARVVGQKGGDENNAVKMAKKSALVDSVLTTWGLSDLFTQDVEEAAPPEHENPEHNPKSPKARERLRRATKDELAGIFAEWQTCHRGEGDEFRKWASEVLSESPAALKQSGTWTKEMIDQCHAKLAKERGEPE